MFRPGRRFSSRFRGAIDAPTLKTDQQKRAERERDAAQAVRDYEAEQRAVHTNMMRLRTLRLAKGRVDA